MAVNSLPHPNHGNTPLTLVTRSVPDLREWGVVDSSSVVHGAVVVPEYAKGFVNLAKIHLITKGKIGCTSECT